MKHVLCSLLLGCGVAVAAERPTQPNVVLILTDDLGWQDVGCYDLDEPSPMETPHIDALAKKGVQFWQGYAPAPTCAPSRCAILSGVHPARAQKTHVVGGAPPTPHHPSHPMIPPWYSGRMPEDTFTLARALQQEGYTTGHSGKWHCAINHHAFPQPEDQGFDWTRSDRGATASMKPHRLTGFATTKKDDPFRLDENGYPYHQTSEDALTFLREQEQSDKPFFLYYATWLVHTPIHTRSEALLDKYCKKLGVKRPDPPNQWTGKGQTNPFYCAMVEMLDDYLGQVFTYLETTEDPRWPGHMLSENTYLIFTSDNGGMEGHPGEIITDNYPLDRGKISIMEGGTRVPLIITGPGIPAGVQSEVMVNGLDFYPTILSWVGARKPHDKVLDGCDLSHLLRHDPTAPARVRDARGQVRDSMVWHFPNSVALESSLRVGGWKLVRNYSHRYVPNTPELELYQLYRDDQGKQVRVDIEESKNLVGELPDKAKAMNQRLTELLTEMKASYPYYNPGSRLVGPEKKQVPTVLAHEQQGRIAAFSYKENGAKVRRADLIYTRNGGEKYEEWFRAPARLAGPGNVSATIPPGATHYILNLVDENNFLVSYPEVPDAHTRRKTKAEFTDTAIKALAPLPVKHSKPVPAQPPSLKTGYDWTPDHLHVGVRWQPFIGRPENNAHDAKRPVIAKDSSYVQFWAAWTALEPTLRNTDYVKHPSSGLKAIEDAVNACVAMGKKVEFVFFHCPKWASVNGESGGQRPKDGEFSKFARRVATHFKGRVNAYQLYHEANLQGTMEDADMDFLIHEILLEGALAIKAVYDAEPQTPVILSTSGCSPCIGCGTRKGLGIRGGKAVSRFYDLLIASPALMEAVDALNLNVSDQNNGYGRMGLFYVTSVWGNYDLARKKLDAAGYRHKQVLSAESWISWDDGSSAVDVNKDGVKNEKDAYIKTVTILGNCLERGLNTINMPWSDNSSGWAMGLTKRRDYNGRVKKLRPDLVVPASDGGADIVTQKVGLRGREDSFTIHDGSGNVFTVEDYINPPDPNHLHYYIWKWYAQIAGGSDEVIRHALAGEKGNDIVVTGSGFRGKERYRIASWNRTDTSFTVLVHSGEAEGNAAAKVSIPSKIKTGRHYNNEYSRTDFRGEGFADGDRYYARITTKDISIENGSDIDPVFLETEPALVSDETLVVTVPRMNRFTAIEFVKLPKE